MMRVIGTRYAGCFFRSRLEARWAVFFDALEIEWHYEAEGYHLPSGPYLPDFSLSRVKCFVEIKPQQLTVVEMRKAYEVALGAEAEGWRFLALEGGEIPRTAEGLPDEFFDCLVRYRFGTHVEQRDRAVQAALDCARSARFEHGQMPDLTAAREVVRNCEYEVGDLEANASYEQGWCFVCAGYHKGCIADDEDLPELEREYDESFELTDLPDDPASRLEILTDNHYEHHHADCSMCAICGCEGSRCHLSAVKDD